MKKKLFLLIAVLCCMLLLVATVVACEDKGDNTSEGNDQNASMIYYVSDIFGVYYSYLPDGGERIWLQIDIDATWRLSTGETGNCVVSSDYTFVEFLREGQSFAIVTRGASGGHLTVKTSDRQLDFKPDDLNSILKVEYVLDGELYETVENINRGSCLFDITVQYDYAIYKFDGWYADNTYTRKWDFTQDRIWEDMKIYGRTVDTRITGINRIYPWINDARIYDESNDIIITTTLQRPDSISLENIFETEPGVTWQLLGIYEDNAIDFTSLSFANGQLKEGDNIFRLRVSFDNEIIQYYSLILHATIENLTITYLSPADWETGYSFTVNSGFIDLSEFGNDKLESDPEFAKCYEGYTVTRWDIISDSRFLWADLVSEDCLISPVCNENTYKAVLNTADESGSITETSVVYNFQYTFPVPFREYYTFNGWVLEDGTKMTDADGHGFGVWKIPADTELFAAWTRDKYNVTLTTDDTLGAEVVGTGVYEVLENVTVEARSPLGYDFDGWYNGDTLLSTEGTYTFQVPVNGAAYKAKWKVKDEMSMFGFVSDMENCVITEIKDTSIIAINIPGYVTAFGAYKVSPGEYATFDWGTLTGAESVTVSESNKYFSSHGGILYSSEPEIIYVPVNISGEIELLQGITHIGDFALERRNGITSLTIPASVTALEMFAVARCDELASVYIPENVTEINRAAFAYCTKLVSIKLPDTLTEIGEQVFEGCTKLTSVELPSSLTIISGNAFSGCTQLASVELPDTLKSIGSQAFSGCTGLQEIVLSDTIKYIGAEVFINCTGLTSITIGAGVTEIGKQVFAQCSNLSKIKWMAVAVESIGSDVFRDAGITSAEGMEALFGDGVQKIPSVFYNCSGLTSVIISNSVTSIDSGAFKDCGNLTTLHIGENVKVINQQAFACNSLKQVFWNAIYVSDGNITSPMFYNAGTSNEEGFSVVFGNKVEYIPEGAFNDTSKLVSIIIQNEETEISYNAFKLCAELVYAEVPTTVIGELPRSVVEKVVLTKGEYIGNRDFNGFSSLVSLTIPETVTNIDNEAFSECTALTEVFWNAIAVDYADRAFSSVEPGKDRKIVFGDSVEKIPAGIFSSQENPGTIVFGKSIKVIGARAFAYCTGLTSMTIPDSVTSIGSSAFDNCTGLTSVTVGTSVTDIGDFAFSGCIALQETHVKNLAAWSQIKFATSTANPLINGGILYCGGNKVTDLSLLSGVGSIEEFSFAYYTGLTSVNIPEGVEEIKPYAFFDCVNVKEIIIADSVRVVGDYAFNGCTSAASVVIGQGLEEIASDTFRDCVAISEIYWNAVSANDMPSTYKGLFEQEGSNKADIDVTFGAEVQYIPANLFMSVHQISNVRSLTFGDNVEEIGENAFLKCVNIDTAVVLPDSLQRIGAGAFRECMRLPAITIGNSLDSIEDQAFYQCYNLFEICYTGIRLDLACGADTNGYVAYYAKHISQNFDNDSWYVYTEDGYKFFYDGTAGYLVGYTGEESHLTLPNDFTVNNDTVISEYEIYDYALSSDNNIESVVMSDSVIGIGTNVLARCNALTSITITENVAKVGQAAFSDCPKLSEVYWNAKKVEITSLNPFWLVGSGSESSNFSIIFGNQCTEIPSAFSNIIGLSSVTIGEKISHIENSAFTDCSNLRSITVDDGNAVYHSFGNSIIETATKTLIKGCQTSVIPDDGSVTRIGDYAFYGCRSLASIEIPDNIIGIGRDAFYGTEWYNTQPDGLVYAGSVVYRYKGDMPINTIVNLREDTLGIASRAFIGMSNMVSITIPSGVRYIGEGAFAECSGLIEVFWNAEYVDDLKEHNDIFRNAGNIDTGMRVVIGDNVTRMPAYMFSGYYGNGDYNVTSVIIGKNVASIGEYAFERCEYLTELIWKAIAVDDCPRGMFDNVGNKSQSLVVTFADGVEKIPDRALENVNTVTSVYITDTVLSIGENAFYGCAGLTSVTIPDSVTSIGSSAFQYCTGLTSVTIPDSVTSIGNSAFQYCTRLTSVTIPDSVTSIGDSAFYNCTGLTSATIPNSVTSIGNYAFEDCTGLTSVTIPDSVTSIGERAFYGCTGLTSVTIGNSVTSIGDWAFYGCYKLVEVYNKSSLEITAGSEDYDYVGYYAKNVYTEENGSWFTDTADGYRFLYDGTKGYLIGYYGEATAITLPDSFSAYDGTTITTYEIYQYAFRGNTALISVTISDSVTSIGDWAFYYCTGLISVTIGNSVTSIGDRAFRNCTGLTSVTIGNSVTSIGDDAFRSCTGLTSVTIPDSVTSIGWSAFEDCTGLTSVTIGNSVESIGDYAFDGCTGLTEVYYTGDIAGWCGISFGDEYANPLYYAGNLYIDGQSVTDLVIPDSVTEIKGYAFYGCTGLTSVTIGTSVTSIGRYAFSGCTELSSVVFGDTEGWQVSSSSDFSNYTSLSSAELAYASTAAIYLKSTYLNYYWRKI